MKALNKHPVLKRFEDKQDDFNVNYCPVCDMEYFMTKSDFSKHLDKHQRTEALEDWEDDY